jgi:hypothetical protein
VTGLPEDYGRRPPTEAEEQAIAARVWEMAETLLDDPARSLQISDEWIGTQPNWIASLHMHYLAVVGAGLAAEIVRKHIDLDPGSGDMWVMQHLPGVTRTAAGDTAMQVFVRQLNGEPSVAAELVGAAVTAGGVRALVGVAGEALKLLAHTIQAERDGLWEKVARSTGGKPPARRPRKRPRGRGRRRRG